MDVSFPVRPEGAYKRARARSGGASALEDGAADGLLGLQQFHAPLQHPAQGAVLGREERAPETGRLRGKKGGGGRTSEGGREGTRGSVTERSKRDFESGSEVEGEVPGKQRAFAARCPFRSAVVFLIRFKSCKEKPGRFAVSASAYEDGREKDLQPQHKVGVMISIGCNGLLGGEPST